MGVLAKATALFCIVLALDLVSGDIITSMVELQTLVDTEKRLLAILREALQRETQQLNLAKRYVRKLKKAYNAHLEDTWSDIAAWPVNVFQFIRSVTGEGLVTGYADSIRLLRSQRHFPDEDDVKGSALAFHRLQNTYRIHPRDIAYGRVRGTRETPAFSAREAFIVGHRHASEGYANSATAWLEVALEIFSSEIDKTTLHTELLDWLQFSVYKDTGNAIKALELMYEIQKMDTGYPGIPDSVIMYEDVMKNSTEREIERMKTEISELRYNDDHYAALCRGEDLMDPEVTRQLRCYLETHGNPYLIIQPIKMELANLDPVIIVVHNAILDLHSERIKEIATQHLTRARVVVKTSTAGDVSSARISKLAFLEETVDSVIQMVNTYTGYATNLNVTQAEPLVINNYGVGGYYYSHYDFLRDKDGVGHHLIEPHLGDRIATFLMYMTDVEFGGATVFPEANVTIFPEKGAAAFWYNLYMDGTPDERTLHSGQMFGDDWNCNLSTKAQPAYKKFDLGCPVMSGTKWVADKTYREVGQYPARPCALFQDGPEYIMKNTTVPINVSAV